MNQDTNKSGIIKLGFMIVEQIARAGAQQMLSRALEAEINAYLAGYSGILTTDG